MVVEFAFSSFGFFLIDPFFIHRVYRGLDTLVGTYLCEWDPMTAEQVEKGIFGMAKSDKEMVIRNKKLIGS